MRIKRMIAAGIGIALCANAADDLQGRMETFNLNGPASGMQAEVQVYLPPGYDEAGEPLPVMYFLHGSGGVSGIKILAGFAEEAVRETLCRPFIIVEPRGPNTPQCWWVDAAAIDSKAGTLISRDLIEAVESRYRVMTSREGRIIAGFSMGGFGAMAQLFQHPELFATGVAYDGGFPDDGKAGYEKERLRERIERLFGEDMEALLLATPYGRAARYMKQPEDSRLPVDYQLLVGAFSDRINLFQQVLQEVGAAFPDRIIGTPTQHKLDKVLESCWREHFRFLGQRLAGRTDAPKESYEFRSRDPFLHPQEGVRLKPRVLKLPPSVVCEEDGRVTFQVKAPDAQHVCINFSTERYVVLDMTRGDDGIWRRTFGPLKPGTYNYSFEVDGVWTADPANSQVVIGHQSLKYSLLEISGPGTELWEFQDVPHGAVRIVFYRSPLLGGTLRRCRVYTPPGYDQEPGRSYPVLLLLHGSGGSDGLWTDYVRMHWVADNLIAAGRIEPMIIVMPNGTVSDVIDPFPRSAAFPPHEPEDRLFLGPPDWGMRYVVQSFVTELLPAIRRDFRIKLGRENCGVTGLSMGGGHSIHAGMMYPDVFGYVAPVAPGYGPDHLYSRKQYDRIWADPQCAVNPPAWRIVASREDEYLGNVKRFFLPAMEKAGIPCPLILTEGAHDSATARVQLADHVLLWLFRPVSDGAADGNF